MKRALSSSRCSYLAPPAHPLLPHLVRPLLPSSSFSVGSSKDLDSSPAPRHFSSSSSSSSLPTHETRPRPTRAQREATTKKYERKEERKATKELKSVEKEAREQAFEQGRREELEAKRATSDALTKDLPPFEDAELEGMYRGLMEAKPEDLSPTPLTLASSKQLLLQDPTIDSDARRERLSALAHRLEGKMETPPSEDSEDTRHLRWSSCHESALAKRLQGGLKRVEPKGTVEVAGLGSQGARLLRKIMSEEGAFSEDNKPLMVDDEPVFLGLVARSEWHDIILDCAEAGETDAVLKGLGILQGTVPVSVAELVTDIMAVYASRRASSDALKLAGYAIDHYIPLSVATHHHLLVSMLSSNTNLALRHIYALEAAGHTPLMETYTALIRHLLSPVSAPALIRRGWDLYAHARLTSHPIPSPALYATMIQACARGPNPSPERALDLFTEMVDDNRLAPTREAYDGLIRAYARKPTQESYFEALRFMRQMLDANISPERSTFHAVLEGSRRHGDLPRARWILVNMAKAAGDAAPNEDTMGLVFATYSRYVPAIRDKIRTKPLETSAVASSPLGVDEKPKENGPDDFTQPRGIVDLLQSSSLFYPGPLPQTSREVIVEAENLFIQCVGRLALDGSKVNARGTDKSSVFAALVPSTFLLNNYLSLLCAHDQFESPVRFFETAFHRIGVPKNRYTFEIMMERCESPKNREKASIIAKQVFSEWQTWDEMRGSASEIDDEGYGDVVVGGVGSTMRGVNISCMWTSLIRSLARNYQTEEAISLLKAFVAKYPPTDLITHARELRASQSELPEQPSLVRLSSLLYTETTGELAVDRPPSITFKQVRLLHKRLADVEDKKNVALVKGVCMAYEGMRHMAKEVEIGKVGSWRNLKRGGPASTESKEENENPLEESLSPASM